jgi:hypothetical protein
MDGYIRRVASWGFILGVHESMEASVEPVKTRVKGRSAEAKVGRIKYTLQVLKEIRRDVEEVKLMQRTICAGLRGLFNFKVPMITRIACVDEVDGAILDLLFESGRAGLLPKDLSLKLGSYNVRRFQVTRRLHRMNRRLEKEIGECVAEKRGWHWALTGFAFEVWGEPDLEPDSGQQGTEEEK